MICATAAVVQELPKKATISAIPATTAVTPKVAEALPNNCRRVALGAEFRPKVDQSVGRAGTKLGQCGPSLTSIGRFGPNLGAIGHMLTWADFDQHLPRSGKNVAQLGQELANIGQCWSSLANALSDSADIAPNLAQLGPTLGQISAPGAHVRQPLGKCSAMLLHTAVD